MFTRFPKREARTLIDRGSFSGGASTSSSTLSKFQDVGELAWSGRSSLYFCLTLKDQRAPVLR